MPQHRPPGRAAAPDAAAGILVGALRGGVVGTKKDGTRPFNKRVVFAGQASAMVVHHELMSLLEQSILDLKRQLSPPMLPAFDNRPSIAERVLNTHVETLEKVLKIADKWGKLATKLNARVESIQRGRPVGSGRGSAGLKPRSNTAPAGGRPPTTPIATPVLLARVAELRASNKGWSIKKACAELVTQQQKKPGRRSPSDVQIQAEAATLAQRVYDERSKLRKLSPTISG